MRPMTNKEELWWQQFIKVIDKMPKTVEVHVLNGSSQIAPEGTMRRQLELTGSGDMVEEWDICPSDRLLPFGESN